MWREGNVFERVVSFGALRRAALRAARGKRRSEDTQSFLLHLESNVLALEKELREKTYQPQGYRVFWIYEKKPRMICAAPFRDRVVHHAVCAAMEPRLEGYAIEQSFACRVGKGGLRAMRCAQSYARQYPFFLKLDIQKFFASVDHAVLRGILRRLWKDKDLLWLCDRLIACVPDGFVQGKGLPIGNLTSQQFANLYLGWMDHFVKESLGVRGYVRYMDDFVLFGLEKDDLWGKKARLGTFLQERLALGLNESRVLLAPVEEGIPFLGFRIWPRVIRMSGVTKRHVQRILKRCCGRMGEERKEKGCPRREDVETARSLIAHAKQGNTTAWLRKRFSEKV